MIRGPLIGNTIRDDRPLHAYYNKFRELREERKYYREKGIAYTDEEQLEFDKELKRWTSVLLTWRFHADEVRSFLKEEDAT